MIGSFVVLLAGGLLVLTVLCLDLIGCCGMYLLSDWVCGVVLFYFFLFVLGVGF